MYKMSAMMKDLFPGNASSDLAALKQMANAPAQDTAPQVDYIKESADIKEGSLAMDKDYSVSDFAKLAGVVGQPSAVDLLHTPVLEVDTKTAVAHIDKELDAGDPMIAAGALGRAVEGEALSTLERDELKPYLKLFQQLIVNPSMRARILAMAELVSDQDEKTDEQTLTKEENKGLYHNVNKRKKAGTSRSADHPDAPSDQDWKNAAKTANKTESIKDRLYAQLAKMEK